MREWIKASGGWSDTERDALSDDDLNALFLQLVTGDMRECGLDDADLDEFAWDEYEDECRQSSLQ